MENCIFCKIINKEIPATIIYEDEWVLAFNDLHPQAPVHVLIIPKIHLKDITDLNEENGDYIKAIHFAANKIAQQSGIAKKGYRLLNNCGKDAGQTVFHLHYHLLGGKSLEQKLG